MIELIPVNSVSYGVFPTVKRGFLAAFAAVMLVSGASQPARADSFPLPAGSGSVVGESFTVSARGEDTLLDIARRYGLGRDEMVAANPGVDVWMPGTDTEIRVPRRYVLPDGPWHGVILNLPEMRLYYFPDVPKEAGLTVTTHPVSIGRQDWETPLGETRIVSKVKNPTWYPPASVRAEHAADGDPLPRIVPPGPDNPLGGYAMRLGIPGYLIHGTNKPYGVGMRVSHGCIRMYPEDIVSMFSQVPDNVPVRIINQPVKAGWRGNELYLEVHSPLEEDGHLAESLDDIAFQAVQAQIGDRAVSLDTRAIREVAARRDGVPAVVAVARERSDAGMTITSD